MSKVGEYYRELRELGIPIKPRKKPVKTKAEKEVKKSKVESA